MADDTGEETAKRGGRPTAPSPPLAYRRDIDGLRAVAVLPIVFNHLGLRGFGGGYVGVDVFFVISGFLITGVLLRDMTSGRHSIGDFYRRRLLRIFPALFAVLAIVTALAWPAMLPGELVRYARSLGATALFASNLQFYAETGYFDAASHVKPLLHTWSLAIEEQFYLLWPLLLMAVGPHRPTRLRAALGAIVMLSFVASVSMLRVDASSAFYLLPSRAWELGVGGLIATLRLPVGARWLREGAAAVALAALGWAIWRFSSVTPFPAEAALLPCLATAALIASGPHTLVARALAIGPIVFVGLISYSLYLWHWPVVVFAEILLILPPTRPVIAAEILVSLLLATLSWRYIETPFRTHARGWSTRAVLSSSAAASTVGLVVAAGLLATGGAPGRFSARQQAIAHWGDADVEASYRRGECFIVEAFDRLAPHCLKPDGNRPTILLIGDSQAAHLWPGVAGWRDRYDMLQATIVGCPPGLYAEETTTRCARFFRTVLGSAIADPPDLVLLSGQWRLSELAMVDRTLTSLRRAHVPVLLVGPIPAYDAALPRLLVLADRRDDPRLPARALDRSIFAADAALRVLADRHGVAFVSIVGHLCRPTGCRTEAVAGVPMQFDASHLTPAGSGVVAALIEPAVARAIAR